MWFIIILIVVVAIVIIAKKSANAKAERLEREEARQKHINDFVAVLPDLPLEVLLNQRKRVQEIYNTLWQDKGTIHTKEPWLNPGNPDLFDSLDLYQSRTVLKILDDEIKKRGADSR